MFASIYPRITQATRYWLLGALTGLLLAGVAQGAPLVYERQGVRFNHPQDWTVSEETGHDGQRVIFAESPGEALVIVIVRPREQAPALAQFARQFSAEAASSTPMAKSRTRAFSPVGKAALREEFDISL